MLKINYNKIPAFVGMATFMFIILFFNLYSQDKIDPPKIYSKDTSSVFDASNNKFLIGWNWSGDGRKIDSLLNINSHHRLPWTFHTDTTKRNIYVPDNFSNDMNDSTKGIVVLENISDNIILGSRSDTAVFNGISLHLEPSITVDKTENFKPRFGDNTGAVYGFKYRNFGIGDTVSSGNDFSRFILRKDSISSTPQIALDSIWDGSILRYEGYERTNNHRDSSGTYILVLDSINTQTDEKYFHPYNGKQFYLSMNLRAVSIDSVKNHLLDTILSIKLPYTMKDYTSGFTGRGVIKFDSIPDTSFAMNRTIYGNQNNDYRGYYRGLKTFPSNDTVLYITGNMLQVLFTSSNNITLSAFFKCTGKQILGQYVNNPPFKDDWWANLFHVSKYIDSINVQVKYYGKLDVAVDYIRFDSPQSRKIMFGGVDKKVKQSLDSTLARLARNIRHPRLFRFYSQDEIIPMQYSVNRYYNILLDTLAETESYIFDNLNHAQYNYALGFKEYRIGSTISHDWNPATPYIKKAKMNKEAFGSPKTLRVFAGYSGNIYFSLDSLNSGYETYERKSIDWGESCNFVNLPLSSSNYDIYDKTNFYKDTFYLNNSTQSRLEKTLYNDYYKNNQSLLYSGQKWWSNLWVTFGLDMNDSVQTFTYGYRPRTGEEIRMMTNSPLILGTKGLFYWYKTGHPVLQKGKGVETAILKNHESTFLNSLPSGIDLAYSDMNGGDWVDLKDSTFYDFKHNFVSSFYDWSSMGIDLNHIYFGNKSTTVELWKVGRFIKDNESTLMKLNLLSWYGKGYLTLNSHSPSVADTFMTSIINVDSIKTKKLFQPKLAGDFDTQIQSESRDSSFFDVTILKYDNFLTDWVFYIGVQNRRTDPLLWDSSGGSWRLNFIPTAKFDSLVATGGTLNGTSYSASQWQDLWWKRLGCREISIPMKINNKDGSGNEKYALLKVTEMTTTHPELNYFNNSITSAEVDKLYPKVEKVIGQDGKIVANYLPGEMKIFKVQVLPPAELTGKLDNINQNKMVSMPVYSSGTMTNEVVYYTTYYENDNVRKANAAKLAVSRPIDKNSNYSDIVWIGSSTISDTLIVYNGSGPITINPDNSGTFYNSYHPTIAVRKDSTNPDLHSVFILYSVKRPNPTSFADSLITIAETKYTFNPTSLALSKDYNHEISKVKFLLEESLIDFGTPTINSSKDVLFYAWSGRSYDSLRQGIFYTIKKPNETGIGAVHCISDSLFPDWSSNSTMLHPSLNTYSNTISFQGYSNHATLVWDQDKCTNGQQPDRRLIYMTNLYYNSSSNVFNHYLRPINNSSNFKDGVYFYNDSNIVKFNWGGSAGIYPSVFSEIIFPENYVINKDYLAFERRWSDISRIFLMTIRRQYSNWDVVQPMFTIMTRYDEGHTYNTLQPVVKQPSTILDPYLPPSFSKSKVLLNFKLKDSYNGTNDIYQFNMNEGLAIGTLTIIDSTYHVYSDNKTVYNINKIASDANQNHLAASPIMNYDPTAWKNRRIFETGTNKLLTSARYFYKQSQDGLEIQNYFGYTTDTTSLYIGEINRENSQLKMRLPYTVNIDTVNGNTIDYDNRDSICSDWFTVNTTTNIDFKIGGRNPLNSKIFIQRRDSNSINNLSVNLMGGDSIAVLVKLMLINGNNKDYRLVIVKTDTLNVYEEQMVLGGKPILDTVYFKGNKSKVMLIDLNGRATLSGGNDLILNVTPNPAEIEAYAIAYIPNEHLMERQSGENKLVISLYNAIGMLIKEVNCVSGETVKFDLRELGNGNYFVKVREKAETFYDQCKPVQMNLIIKR